jgi:predicted nucleic acid-binding protein
MYQVFADTLYWVATVRPNDPYERAAKEARQSLPPCIIVTTDEVLYEFVTAFAKSGPRLREKAVRIARELLDSPNVQVLPQSRESFLRAMDRFGNRPDKQYSLTDCSYMNVMDAEDIRDVLTNDRHFQQEGFNVLIRLTEGGNAR